MAFEQFVLTSGQDLITEQREVPTGPTSWALQRSPRNLSAIWSMYTKWVLGRVHFEKALLKPDPEKIPADILARGVDLLLADLGSRGFANEAAEVSDEHKKLFYHGSDYATKRAKIVEELGDALWYLVPTMKAHNITLEEVLAFNVDKLVGKDGVKGEKFDERAKSGQ